MDYSDDGFLLHFAVSKGLKEHVQLLLAQGLGLFYTNHMN